MVWSIDPRRETLRGIQWHHSTPRFLFGTRAAEPILAGGHVQPPTTDRTYDRKRSVPLLCTNLLQVGAVHIWIPGSRLRRAPE